MSGRHFFQFFYLAQVGSNLTPKRFFRRLSLADKLRLGTHAIHVVMSMLLRSGATPKAIASATMPSIRPVDLFFDSLRLASSFASTTAHIAFIARTGWL